MKCIVSTIIAFVLLAAVGGSTPAAGSKRQPAAGSAGPALGTWEFAGQDAQGVSWKGTLKLEKLDTSSFDAATYHAMFTLDVKAGDAQRSVEAPFRWDAARREILVTTGMRSAPTEYTATLSPDGKSLTGGKWTQKDQDLRTKQVTVKSTGTWSAKFVK